MVSRLEMDSRWALARSVRALVAERDALKEKLETRQALLPIASGGRAKTDANDLILEIHLHSEAHRRGDPWLEIANARFACKVLATGR
jgi:hypothetical protein